jgi:hypothetical protein
LQTILVAAGGIEPPTLGVMKGVPPDILYNSVPDRFSITILSLDVAHGSVWGDNHHMAV